MRLLHTFLEQKGQRLRKSGIHNVFGHEQAREMLKQLAFASFGTQEPLLRLHGLEIGGKIRAVFGCGVKQSHVSGYFSSIAEDELAAISPGEMLLYLVTEYYCAKGLATMDLGGGDERYKRSWCEEQQELFDVIMPANALGIPLAAIEKIFRAVRHRVRRSPHAWTAITHVRRTRARLFWR
jgi:CelD/BcsL family acetyltransferase involved in cellulose biosynthesis